MANDARRKMRRSRRGGRVGTYLLVLLFAGTGVVAYWRGQPTSPSPDARCVAVVRVPTAEKTSMEREILASANLERVARRLGAPAQGDVTPREIVELAREHLSLSVGKAAPNGVDVSIRYSGPAAGQLACGLVNTLANQYAESRRLALEAAADKSNATVQAQADRAERELIEAQGQFDGFLDQYFREERGLLAGSTPAESRSASANRVSPEWANTKRQLDDVRRHREQLLIDRTPMHPQVRDADVEIVELEKRLSEIAPELVASPSDRSEQLKEIADLPPVLSDPATRGAVEIPNPSGGLGFQPEKGHGQDGGATVRSASRPVLVPNAPPSEVFRTYAEKRDRLATARRTYGEASQAERRAWQSRCRLPRIEVELAAPPSDHEGAATVSRVGASPWRLVAALAVGLAGAISAAMVSAGTTTEATFESASQVRTMIGVPVVGVVAGAEPGPRPRRRQGRFSGGGLLVSCGLLLMGLCLGAAIAVVWGVQLG
jgi:hypothetical protein